MTAKLVSVIAIIGLAALLVSGVRGLAEESPETKSGYEHDPGFAGPTSSTAQLEEDNEVKEPAIRLPGLDNALQPWFDWKAKLNERYGIEFGMAYTSLYQWVNDTPNGVEDHAGSGIFRFSGKWTAFKDNSGNAGRLVVNFDQRHRYSTLAPADLGFAVGYLGIPGSLFNNAQSILGDLNWQQTFNDNKTGIVIGRYDPNDYFDVLGYANPFTTFQSLHILFNTSLALPDWSTGLGVGHWFGDQWYIKAAANDVNGVATKTDFQFEIDELYKTAEVGWSPQRAERYLKNAHITYWHADEAIGGGGTSSQGVAVGANWTWNKSWMLFAKAGWSKGATPLYNKTITVGMIHYFATRSDLFGLGVNWGDPADDSLREQTTGEAFYRIQLAQNLAITPSMQWFVHPSLNPEKHQLWLASLRLRFAF